MSFITFKNVKKIYKMGEVEISALNGVNFTIEEGEFIIIAGASGAGKNYNIEPLRRHGYSDIR